MNLVDMFFRKKNSRNDLALPSENEGIIIKEFSEKFDITFSDPKLLINALKHRSYLNVTNEDRVASNERLEFLGDAVLDLIVTHYLFVKFPKRTEGQLSKIKSILVSKPVLAEIAAGLSLGEFLLVNRGEEKTGGRKRQSILADTFEAIIGAIYLDQGLEAADNFIMTHLLSRFKYLMQRELYRNYKSILLEYAQAKSGILPRYKVIEEIGPDHDKQFIVAVYLDDLKVGEGEGKSKKTAEQEAARHAIEKLKIQEAP